MPTKSNRKNGIRAKRRREARRLLRDRKIYRKLWAARALSLFQHQARREPVEPGSVYFGKEHLPPQKLTSFPVPCQDNGLRMPHWDDLSAWLKAQVAVLAFENWQFLTYSIHIHPDLESRWVAEGKEVRAEIGVRLRKEFDKSVRKGLEHFFVVEGWSKLTKSKTVLHFHGAAAMYEPADAEKIKQAVARAGGHNVKGRARMPRAVHSKPFTQEGPFYINYLFKSVRRSDDRLGERRVSMSRSAVGATRVLWDHMVGR